MPAVIVAAGATRLEHNTPALRLIVEALLINGLLAQACINPSKSSQNSSSSSKASVVLLCNYYYVYLYASVVVRGIGDVGDGGCCCCFTLHPRSTIVVRSTSSNNNNNNNNNLSLLNGVGSSGGVGGDSDSSESSHDLCGKNVGVKVTSTAASPEEVTRHHHPHQLKISSKRKRNNNSSNRISAYLELTLIMLLIALGGPNGCSQLRRRLHVAGLTVLTVERVVRSVSGAPVENTAPPAPPAVVGLDLTANRAERSANLSHITGASRKIQMYVKNRHLQIMPDGTVSGSTDDSSQYSELYFFIFCFVFSINALYNIRTRDVVMCVVIARGEERVIR